jgi:hypothetical protein
MLLISMHIDTLRPTPGMSHDTNTLELHALGLQAKNRTIAPKQAQEFLYKIFNFFSSFKIL